MKSNLSLFTHFLKFLREMRFVKLCNLNKSRQKKMEFPNFKIKSPFFAASSFYILLNFLKLIKVFDLLKLHDS